MTHEDAGHYAAKHSPDTKLNEKIAEAVRLKLKAGKISCAAAHKIARDLGVTPAEVGVTIDLLEARINKCQLGLYGYVKGKSVVKPAEHVSKELRDAIENSLVAGRLSCTASWEISEKFGIPKMHVSSASELLTIKISACQLGSFR